MPPIPPPHVVILGAGATGFGAAEYLSTLGAGVTVVEACATPGGLAGSAEFGPNRYDFGTHILHTDDPDLESMLRETVGPDFLPIGREIRIKWGKSHLRYPLRISDVIAKMPPWTTTLAGFSFLAAQLRQRPVTSAEDALINAYGRVLYRIFFEKYSAHFWGRPATALSPVLVNTRIPRLDAFQMVKTLLQKLVPAAPSTASTTVEEVRGSFYYHPRASLGIYEAWQQKLERRGVRFAFDRRVTGLPRDGNRVTAVEMDTPTGPERMHADAVVATIPLPRLVEMLDGPALPEPGLRYRSLLVWGLLVRAENLLPAYFVYYHNRIFGRLAEPKNTGLRVTPPDATILLAEIPCEYEDERWTRPEDLYDRVVADLEQEGLITRDQVLEWHVMKQRYAYPLFVTGYEAPLEAANTFLKTLNNIQSAGRQGEFRYVNQHIAIKAGTAAAKRVHATLLDSQDR